jgi:predicted Zn-dependent peptidase
MHWRSSCTALLLFGLAAPLSTGAPAPAGGGYRVPVEYHKLDNGLKVVLSTDTTAPKVVVAVYYNIGFRIEPKGRTGFAHLFEHMMFQGSQNLGKMEFVRLVQANGGVLNGSTRFDHTNYYQIVPSHALEPVLWAEADRMRGLVIDAENLKNQQEVVKNEVKVNVLNRPYGGFPWLDLPQYANTNWHNAHNFYGDLAELDAATLDDVRVFFETYYTPSNAVVVVVGDIDPAQTLALVKKYFAPLRKAARPVTPDISEPRQEQERRARRRDALATRPALAVAYHAPARHTPDYYALGLIDQILLQGKDSRLWQALVERGGFSGEVTGGINAALGHMFNIAGPTLWMASLVHDATQPSEKILAAFDEQVEALRNAPVDATTLQRARVKLRSQLYGQLESFYGFGRADLLASLALFDDDPARINRLEAEFERITPEQLQATAREYLRPGNRTILVLEPGADAPAGGQR